MTTNELMNKSDLKAAADSVKADHEAFIAAGRMMAQHAVNVGHALRKVKLGLPHGDYSAWVSENCGFGRRHASTYMLIAQKSDRGDISEADLLVASVRKLLTDEVEPESQADKATSESSALPNIERSSKATPTKVKQALGEGKARFKVVLDAIQKLRSDCHALSEIPQCGEHIILTALDTSLRQAASTLKSARPHSRCVYCAKKGDRQEGCDACGGRGWISRGLFASAPEDLRKLAK